MNELRQNNLQSMINEEVNYQISLKQPKQLPELGPWFRGDALAYFITTRSLIYESTAPIVANTLDDNGIEPFRVQDRGRLYTGLYTHTTESLAANWRPSLLVVHYMENGAIETSRQYSQTYAILKPMLTGIGNLLLLKQIVPTSRDAINRPGIVLDIKIE